MAKTDAVRKNGLVINSGRKQPIPMSLCLTFLVGYWVVLTGSHVEILSANPTKEIREALREEYLEKYGLGDDVIAAIDLARPVTVSEKLNVKELSKKEMRELLCILREQLTSYTKRLVRKYTCVKSCF